MTGAGPGDGHLRELLSALLDGELAPGEADRARAHLAGCHLCTAELDSTRQVRSLVRRLPPVEPPVPLTAPPRRWERAVGVGAAVAAALATVLMANVQAETPNPPSAASLVEDHATSLINVEPLSHLAPAAVPLSER